MGMTGRRYSIRTRLMASMMAITVISSLIICAMSYWIASNITIRNAKQSSSNICKQLADNISRELEDVSQRQFNAMWNYNVGNELYEVRDNVTLSHQMTSYLEYYITNPYIKASIIYTDNQIFEPSRFLQSKEQGEQLAVAYEKNRVSEEKRGSVWYSSDQNGLILQQAVVAADRQYKIVGTQITEIDLDKLVSNCLGYEHREGQCVVLCDKNGKVCSESMKPYADMAGIFWNQAESESESELCYNKEKYLVYLQPLQNIGINMFYILDEKTLLSDIGLLGKTIGLICVGALLAAGITTGYLTKSMTKNIDKLIEHIKAFDLDEYSNIELPKERDEISDIMVEFNKMSQKIQGLIEVNYNNQLRQRELEVKALQFEYSALQSYINPHFLYNTLETISSMAKIQGARDVSEATCLLGDLLREGIRPGENMFPLKEELSYIKKYLELQKLSMGDRLQVKYEVPERLYEAMVPKLILQPIVENAIMHGMEDVINCGRIEIKAEEIDGTVTILVSDNGKGIPSDKLEKIRNGSLEMITSSSHVHIGIKSVHKRIQILYGKEYGVVVESGAGGTQVKISIPFSRSEGGNA